LIEDSIKKTGLSGPISVMGRDGFAFVARTK
jgi:hypothetical protein